jgi:hypothetical protein
MNSVRLFISNFDNRSINLKHFDHRLMKSKLTLGSQIFYTQSQHEGGWNDKPATERTFLFCLVRGFMERKLNNIDVFHPFCVAVFLLNYLIGTSSSFHLTHFCGGLKLCIYDWTAWNRHAVSIHYLRQREVSHSSRQVVKPPTPNPVSRYDSSIDGQTKPDGSCVINNTNLSALLTALFIPYGTRTTEHKRKDFLRKVIDLQPENVTEKKR